jgi:hypothetical protein
MIVLWTAFYAYSCKSLVVFLKERGFESSFAIHCTHSEKEMIERRFIIAASEARSIVSSRIVFDL